MADTESTATTRARHRVASPILGGEGDPEDKAKEQKKWAGETLLKGLEKGLDLTGEFFSKVHHDPDPDTPLAKAAREVLVGAVKDEGWKLVDDYVPYGKAVHIAVDLSKAFAEGVGEALEQVNAKLQAEYERPVMESGDVTDQDVKLIRYMCAYQANAARELPRILKRGVEEMKNKAMELVKEKVVSKVSEAVKDVCGQVAEQLFKQNDLLATCSTLVGSAAEKIPEGRRKVYGIAFHFVLNAFVDQFGSEKLKSDLQPGLSASVSEKPIDVAIFSGILEIVAHKSYGEFMKRTGGDQIDAGDAEKAIEDGLLDQANKVLTRMKSEGRNVEPASVDRVTLQGNAVKVPAALLQRVEGRGPAPAEAKSRFINRYVQFGKMVEAYRVLLMAKQRNFQFELDHGRGDIDDLQKQLTQAQDDARERAVRARSQVLAEFGPEFNGEKTVDNFSIELPPAKWRWPGGSTLDGCTWPKSITSDMQDYGSGYLLLIDRSSSPPPDTDP
jgi:hypothetical protein